MLNFPYLTPALCAVLLLALGACGDRDGEAPAPKAPPVEVLTVREQPVIPRFEYVGRVEAMNELDVRPRVEGHIESRHFIEGDRVEKGALLYKIDPRPFIAALDNARAARSRAEAALRLAERNYRRGRELIETGAISKVQMDELQGNFEEAEASLREAQANVETAELNLSYTDVTSPLSGRAGVSQYTEGSLVGPQSEPPLTTIVSINPIYVRFEVPEDRLFAVQLEQVQRRERGVPPERRDIRILQPDGNFYPHRGEIVFVDNQVNLNTGSVLVRARFPNPEGLLVQGQFARVSIRVFSGADQVKPLVPQAAVMEDMQGRYVYAIESGEQNQSIAKKRYLKLGQREGELWAVEDGLNAGEVIIVNGLQRVAANKPVTPQNTPRDPYTGEGAEGVPSGMPPSPVGEAGRDEAPLRDENGKEVYDGK